MNHFPSLMAFVGEFHRENGMNSYEKAIARMELEAKRAKAQVTMLKMLYKELQEQKKKEKVMA